MGRTLVFVFQSYGKYISWFNFEVQHISFILYQALPLTWKTKKENGWDVKCENFFKIWQYFVTSFSNYLMYLRHEFFEVGHCGMLRKLNI